MSEPFERLNKSWEARTIELRGLVKEAKQQALPEAEADKFQAQLDDSTRQLIKGEISIEEFGLINREIDTATGAVFVDTLPEYRFLLECAGFNVAEIENTLAHENDHMLVARDIPDGHLRYGLQFMKTKDGFAMRPSVRVDWPEGLKDEGTREKIKQALVAPDNLSDSDKQKLRSEG